MSHPSNERREADMASIFDSAERFAGVTPDDVLLPVKTDVASVLLLDALLTAVNLPPAFARVILVRAASAALELPAADYSQYAGGPRVRAMLRAALTAAGVSASDAAEPTVLTADRIAAIVNAAARKDGVE